MGEFAPSWLSVETTGYFAKGRGCGALGTVLEKDLEGCHGSRCRPVVERVETI